MIFEKINGSLKGDFKNLPDGKYEVKKIKQTRSLNQNALYHKYLSDIKKAFDEQGIFITTDDLHEGLKQKLLPSTYKKNPLTGKRTIIQKTTTKLTTKEFSEYIKDIEKYLISTFDISVMLATDVGYNN